MVLWWVCLLLVAKVHGAIVTYNFTITFEIPKSKCFTAPQMLVNGETPGPTIRATEGDTLVINIFNRMAKEEFTMHYHGLHQKSTPFYDGVPDISQTTVKPGKDYQQRMIINQSGTYLYHSHTKLHATTAMGALIIKSLAPPPFKYDEELLVLLSDRVFATRASGLNYMGHLSSGIWFNGAPGIADNNTRASNPACKATIFVVEPNKTYRLRIISGTTLSYASFAIAGHMLEVVEAEGFYTTPVKLDKIPLHTGQRYSIILRTTNTARTDFRIHTHTMNKDGTTSLHGMTLLRYSAPAKPDRIGSEDRYNPAQMPYTDSRLTALGEVPLSGSRLPFDVDWPMDWRTTSLGERAASSLFTPLVPNPAPPATRRLYYRVTHEEREPEETPRWFVNNVTIKHPALNLMAEAYKNTTHNHDETNYRLEHLDGNQVVEIVIQNTVDMVGVCDNHPWHLHGHSFWDMGSGPGKFSLEETQAYSPNPILRDTFTFALNLPQSGLNPRDDCGWHAVRFLTDNPGLWIFHCHILQHLDYGMVIYFAEDPNNLPTLPKDITNL